MFIIWNNGFSFRPTMDADIEFRGDGSPASLERVFREVCIMPGVEEDGVAIDAGTVSAFPIREDDQYGGVRVTMTAKIGSVRVPVQVDVGIGDTITPRARSCDFPVMLDHSALRLKVYPSPSWRLNGRLRDGRRSCRLLFPRGCQKVLSGMWPK